MHSRSLGLRSAAMIGMATLGSAAAAAQDTVADFFKGRQISIIVGSSAGGGYDTYSRMIARHMGRHVPGTPGFIVSNQPGAGGNVLANQLATIGPKDGTTIGAPQSGVIFEPLLGTIPVKHEPAKFHYLGSANNDVYICIARADAPAATFADVLQREIIIAASNASSTADYAQILANTVGARFRIVMGYAGSREIALAIDKGEAQGACGLAWPSISVTQGDWFTEGPVKSRMRVILQTHSVGHPELNAAGVPLAISFARNDEQRAILNLFFSQSQFGRPYILPAETPPERVAALRQAFAATMADPQFKAEAAKFKLDVDTVPGEAVQKVVADIYAAPPELIAKTKQALQQKK